MTKEQKQQQKEIIERLGKLGIKAEAGRKRPAPKEPYFSMVGDRKDEAVV